MSSLPHAADAAESSGGTGPGHLLRSARVSAGMSVRDVSAQLRLDDRTVAALEGDDFEHLPAPTFVRGYLRGYARLLGVPVGPVMEAYDREGFSPPDLVADISEAPDTSTGDFPVGLVTAAVITVLVLLVILWWNSQSFEDLPPPEATAEGDATPPGVDAGTDPPATIASTRELSGIPGDESPTVVLPVPPPAAPATGTVPATQAPAMEGGESPVDTASPAPATVTDEGQAVEAIARAEGVLERTRTEVDAIVTDAAPAPTETDSESVVESSAETAAADAQTASTDAASPEVSAPVTAAASAPGNGRLVMRFPIEAWVEVYDSGGDRLFYNLARAGRVVDVTGTPPIRVLLGRTRGVTVEYEGEAVDLAPHTDKGVARFTLGQ